MTIKEDTIVSGYRQVKFDKMFSFFIANLFSRVGVRKIASFFFFLKLQMASFDQPDINILIWVSVIFWLL